MRSACIAVYLIISDRLHVEVVNSDSKTVLYYLVLFLESVIQNHKGVRESENSSKEYKQEEPNVDKHLYDHSDEERQVFEKPHEVEYL